MRGVAHRGATLDQEVAVAEIQHPYVRGLAQMARNAFYVLAVVDAYVSFAAAIWIQQQNLQRHIGAAQDPTLWIVVGTGLVVLVVSLGAGAILDMLIALYDRQSPPELSATPGVPVTAATLPTGGPPAGSVVTAVSVSP